MTAIVFAAACVLIACVIDAVRLDRRARRLKADIKARQDQARTTAWHDTFTKDAK